MVLGVNLCAHQIQKWEHQKEVDEKHSKFGHKWFGANTIGALQDCTKLKAVLKVNHSEIKTRTVQETTQLCNKFKAHVFSYSMLEKKNKVLCSQIWTVSKK